MGFFSWLSLPRTRQGECDPASSSGSLSGLQYYQPLYSTEPLLSTETGEHCVIMDWVLLGGGLVSKGSVWKFLFYPIAIGLWDFTEIPQSNTSIWSCCERLSGGVVYVVTNMQIALPFFSKKFWECCWCSELPLEVSNGLTPTEGEHIEI